MLIQFWRYNIDYGLVFRTFGSDCVEIVQEFNAFCSAPHKVCDNEEVVSSLLSKVVDVDKAIGKITRGGNGPDEPETYSLKMGSAVEKPLVVNGAKNIYSYFISSIFDQNKRSMMIQDDYPYWHACEPILLMCVSCRDWKKFHLMKLMTCFTRKLHPLILLLMTAIL
jgi:hypothetical protein